jgi:hypothetical protein
VTNENPHCHPSSLKELEAEHVLSDIRTDSTVETAGNVVRQLLRGTSAAAKTALPTDYNMKRTVNRQRQKSRDILLPLQPAHVMLSFHFKYYKFRVWPF